MLAEQSISSAFYAAFFRVLSQVELQSLPSLARVQNIQQIRHSTFVVVEVGLRVVRDVLSGQETRVLLNNPGIS